MLVELLLLLQCFVVSLFEFNCSKEFYSYFFCLPLLRCCVCMLCFEVFGNDRSFRLFVTVVVGCCLLLVFASRFDRMDVYEFVFFSCGVLPLERQPPTQGNQKRETAQGWRDVLMSCVSGPEWNHCAILLLRIAAQKKQHRSIKKEG